MVKRRRGVAETEVTMENFAEEVSTELTLYHDPWKIKKKLNKSDLGHLCRVILPKEQVESHLSQYWGAEEWERLQSSDEGIRVQIKDVNTQTQHVLTLKRWWRTNKSYVLEAGWSDLVRRRGLTVGEAIGLFWNGVWGYFYFSVFRPYVPPPQPPTPVVIPYVPLQPLLVNPDPPSLCEFACRYLTLGPSPFEI